MMKYGKIRGINIDFYDGFNYTKSVINKTLYIKNNKRLRRKLYELQ